MKKINNIILYKDLAYVNNQNKNITKDEIVTLFDNAYDEGCMNFKKEESEICTNYIFEQEQEKTIVTIPTILIELNKKFIEQLDDVLLRTEQLKDLKNEHQEKIEKREKIKKLKKYAAIATLGIAGIFALSKSAPEVKYISEKIVEWDDRNFEREIEESGAKEIQQNLEIEKNYEEAMEHFYEDKMIEQQQIQQQINGFEVQQEQFNQEQTQKMIDDMEQYRDLDTMPYVEKVR